MLIGLASIDARTTTIHRNNTVAVPRIMGDMGLLAVETFTVVVRP